MEGCAWLKVLTFYGNLVQVQVNHRSVLARGFHRRHSFTPCGWRRDFLKCRTSRYAMLRPSVGFVFFVNAVFVELSLRFGKFASAAVWELTSIPVLSFFTWHVGRPSHLRWPLRASLDWLKCFRLLASTRLLCPAEPINNLNPLNIFVINVDELVLTGGALDRHKGFDGPFIVLERAILERGCASLRRWLDPWAEFGAPEWLVDVWEHSCIFHHLRVVVVYALRHSHAVVALRVIVILEMLRLVTFPAELRSISAGSQASLFV